ncbi:MAG: GNAT family N-acetyltransferase [Planctomycetota bacterium]
MERTAAASTDDAISRTFQLGHDIVAEYAVDATPPGEPVRQSVTFIRHPCYSGAMAEIIEAQTDEHYRRARRLIEAYAAELGMDLEFQGFSDELNALATMYGPPQGAMLLLRDGGSWIGCAGLRPLEKGIAELKRMFIRPEHRGRGLGHVLMDALIATARQLGCEAIRLDTLASLRPALALYRRSGFVEIRPYRHTPLPQAVFLELAVKPAPSAP